MLKGAGIPNRHILNPGGAEIIEVERRSQADAMRFPVARGSRTD